MKQTGWIVLLWRDRFGAAQVGKGETMAAAFKAAMNKTGVFITGLPVSGKRFGPDLSRYFERGYEEARSKILFKTDETSMKSDPDRYGSYVEIRRSYEPREGSTPGPKPKELKTCVAENMIQSLHSLTQGSA